MNYEELVKALRDIEKTMFALGTSQINMGDVSISLSYDKRWGQTAEAAAAAIEELQAEIRESMQKCAECGDRMVEPKQGEWIEDTTTYAGPGLSNYKCSLCGKICGTWRRGLEPRKLPNWCGNCGADMRAKMEVQE